MSSSKSVSFKLVSRAHEVSFHLSPAKDHVLLSCLGGLGRLPGILPDPAAEHLPGAHQTGRGTARKDRGDLLNKLISVCVCVGGERLRANFRYLTFRV